jgi:curli biogenesis system outer membrane secretion channel CsgG
MSNPVTHAFFFGRALAETLSEKLEESLTTALSELGRFDAQQRENLRQFVEEVQIKAEREMSQSNYTETGRSSDGRSEDLQETIDDLRAEIATLKANLKAYRVQIY